MLLCSGCLPPGGLANVKPFLPVKKLGRQVSTVTVSDKGQVVMPVAIRRRLGWVPGSKLDFELEGDSLNEFDVAEAMRAQDDDRP